MSAADLSRMGKLKQVLRLCSHGRGIAASLVETFRESGRDGEARMVRNILLGHTVRRAMTSLERNDRDGYTGDLMAYVVEQARIDAEEASRGAEKLTGLFEHWIWMKRQRATDQKVMETRSLMVSAILGGVTAMVSSIAPILGSFQLSLGTSGSPPYSAPGYSPYLGILFVIPAASFLGLFFSRRRAYVNVLVAGVTYLFVAYFFSPLVTTL